MDRLNLFHAPMLKIMLQTNLLVKHEPRCPRLHLNNLIICAINFRTVIKVNIALVITCHSKYMIATHWCDKESCHSIANILIIVTGRDHVVQLTSLDWIFFVSNLLYLTKFAQRQEQRWYKIQLSPYPNLYLKRKALY